MIFGSKKGVPGPWCPACDAPLDTSVVAQAQPRCPACGQSLAPVRVAGFWRRSLAAIDADATERGVSEVMART